MPTTLQRIRVLPSTWRSAFVLVLFLGFAPAVEWPAGMADFPQKDALAKIIDGSIGGDSKALRAVFSPKAEEKYKSEEELNKFMAYVVKSFTRDGRKIIAVRTKDDVGGGVRVFVDLTGATKSLVFVKSGEAWLFDGI